MSGDCRAGDHDSEDVVEVPIDGVLDLHQFRPGDARDVVSDYLDACRENGIVDVRIIHGKGKGVLRRIVHAVLEDRADVVTYRLASDSGSWGATLVRLADAADNEGQAHRGDRRCGGSLPRYAVAALVLALGIVAMGCGAASRCRHATNNSPSVGWRIPIGCSQLADVGLSIRRKTHHDDPPFDRAQRLLGCSAALFGRRPAVLFGPGHDRAVRPLGCLRPALGTRDRRVAAVAGDRRLNLAHRRHDRGANRGNRHAVYRSALHRPVVGHREKRVGHPEMVVSRRLDVRMPSHPVAILSTANDRIDRDSIHPAESFQRRQGW